MVRKEIGVPLDRENLKKHNDNYEELYGVVNNFVGTITDEVYEQIIDGSKLNWKEPVDTSNDLPSDASEGDTRMARDTGKVYRFDGSNWQEIQQIDAGPVNEIDARLTAQLAHEVSQRKSDINNLENDKASKSEVQSGLNAKRDKDVKITKSDYDLGQDNNLWDINDTNERTRAMIQDMEPGEINAVLGEGNVKNENIARNAVYPENTDFVKPSKNLFDKKTIQAGVRIHTDSGEIVEDESYIISDFIPLEPGVVYTRNNLSGLRYYTSDREFIRGFGNDVGTFSTTQHNAPNARFIRLSFPVQSFENLQIEKGEENSEPEEKGIQLIDEKNTDYRVNTILNNRLLVNDQQKKDSPYDVISLLKVDSSYSRQSCFNEIEKTITWRDREESLKIYTTNEIATFTINYNAPLEVTGINEIILIAFVEEPHKINHITLIMGMDDGYWERTTGQNLKYGWNVLRIKAAGGSYGEWDKFNSLRLAIDANEKTSIIVGDIVGVVHDKAKILFVNDHGYHNFKEVAYPQLKERGFPTTWAINPGRLGVQVGNNESILTQEDIDELSYDPSSEFSMHSWDSQPTADMSAYELLEDTHKCLTYIKKNGLLPRYPWRAAFVQNTAPNHEAIKHLFSGYASYQPFYSNSDQLPFEDPYNIARTQLHNRDEAWYLNNFDRLKKTKGLQVIYTHGLDDDGGIHMTSQELDFLLAEIDKGVNEGWLEGTTYSKLMAQYPTHEEFINSL